MTGRAKVDYYSRHPHRVRDALKRGELGFYGYGIVSFFIDEIDHAHGRIESVPYTLRALGDVMAWPLSQEALRIELHNLREAGWIDFPDPKQGQRKPWTFSLGRAAIDAEETATSPPTSNEPPTDLQEYDPGFLEVTSNGRNLDEDANWLAEPDCVAAQPPTLVGPREEQRREEQSVLTHGQGGGRAGAPPPSHEEPQEDGTEDQEAERCPGCGRDGRLVTWPPDGVRLCVRCGLAERGLVRTVEDHGDGNGDSNELAIPDVGKLS